MTEICTYSISKADPNLAQVHQGVLEQTFEEDLHATNHSQTTSDTPYPSKQR